MKEVIKVSIAGIAFALDKEAHKVIETYLNTLRNGYADNPDGSEIVADIEARIAELILTAQPADRVVERELTDKIVAQLGYPDDFEPVAETKSRMQKRLYRSAHGQKIGGVCSGLGVYFGIDPSWIRLGLFVPLMLSIIFSLFDSDVFDEFMGNMFLCFVMLYVLMWIVIPVAKTPREKLELSGKKVTVKNIQENMAESANTISQEKNATVWSELLCVLGRIILFGLKLFVFFIAAIFGLAALAVLIAFVTVLIGGFAGLGFELSDLHLNMGTPTLLVSLGLGSFLLFLISCIYVVIRMLSSKKSSNTPLVILLLLWLLTTVAFGVMTLVNWANLSDDDFIEQLESYKGQSSYSVTGGNAQNNDYDSFDDAMKALEELEDSVPRDTLSVNATIVEGDESAQIDETTDPSTDNDGRKELNVNISTN